MENHLDTLLDALKHLSPDRVSVISRSVENIQRLVGIHMSIEERAFYPAIRSFADDLLPLMLRQHEEIRETERFLVELLPGFPGSPTANELKELYRLGIEFHDAVQVHIIEEEDKLLKRVDKFLSSQQQQLLRVEMQKLEER